MSRGAEILTYTDVLAARSFDCGEHMIAVGTDRPGLRLESIHPEMVNRAGPVHLLRRSVAERLYAAAEELGRRLNGASLLLLSSYRDPEYQRLWHEEIVAEVLRESPSIPRDEASQEANQRVAAPEVAGHICGAAVDVTIVSATGQLEMGSSYLDFRDPETFRVFSSKISASEQRNRILLREAMLSQGFAPFNGEWWHFSYGDREWAAYYGHSQSLYAPVPFDAALSAARSEHVSR